MKRRTLSSLLLLFLLVPLVGVAGAASMEKTRIVVLDFQFQSDGYDAPDTGSAFAEWLTTALVQDGRYVVADRQLLRETLGDDASLTLGTLAAARNADNGWRPMGVGMAVSGSIRKEKNAHLVDFRIVDVETASIVAADHVQGNGDGRLHSLVHRMVEIIVAAVPAQQERVDGVSGRATERRNDPVTRAARLFEERRYEEVIRCLTEAAIAPGNYRATVLLAMARVEKCARLKKENNPAYGRLIHTPYRTGAALLKTHPRKAEPYYIVGKSLLVNHRPSRAIRYLKKAIYFAPGNADYLVTIGDACVASKKYRDAKRYYKLALDADPEDYRLRSQVEERLATAKKLKKTKPNRPGNI